MPDRKNEKIQSSSGQFSEPSLAKRSVKTHFAWARGRKCHIVREDPLQPETSTVTIHNFETATWPRPQLQHANVAQHTSSVELNWPNRWPEVLVCEGEGEIYFPLDVAPNAYLRFANLGRPGWTESPSKSKRSSECLAFVEEFGLPRPGNSTLESHVGLPVSSLLWDANRMHSAVEFLVAVSAALHDGDFSRLQRWNHSERSDNGLLFEAQMQIWKLCDDKLRGVRPAPLLQFEPTASNPLAATLTPGYSCDDLLSAMWLQFYLAATEHRIVRPRCKGCFLQFEAKDRRQQYCDRYCQRANAQRDYYRRSKGVFNAKAP